MAIVAGVVGDGRPEAGGPGKQGQERRNLSNIRTSTLEVHIRSNGGDQPRLVAKKRQSLPNMFKSFANAWSPGNSRSARRRANKGQAGSEAV